MQTNLSAVGGWLTARMSATELNSVLHGALQLPPDVAAKELFPIIRSAYELSETICSYLSSPGETPGTPEDFDSADPTADEYKIANTAFYSLDDTLPAEKPPSRRKNRHEVVTSKPSDPTGEESPPSKGKSRQILPQTQGRTKDKTSVLPRGVEHTTDEDLGPEGHSQFDMDSLTSPATNSIDKFLSSCFADTPISFDVTITSPGARLVREVEKAIREEDRVTELVYAPSMGDLFHQFMAQQKELGDDLIFADLTDELREVLTSGPRLANLCRAFHSEGDVEYVFRASHLTIIAEIINHIEGRKDGDRLYPHRGVIVPKNDRIPGPYHAYPDLELNDCPCEIKKPTSIGQFYLPTLLDIPPRALQQLEREMARKQVFGTTYNFSWPAEATAKISKETQPLVQIYTQMIEKASHFGIASSHDFSYFVVRDPQYQQRLYISRVYSTYRITENTPTHNALYTLYKFLRVACNRDLRDKFLIFFRENAERINPPATGDPIFAANGCIDVGPTSKTASKVDADYRPARAAPIAVQAVPDRPRRDRNPVNYEDASTSRASHESVIPYNPAPPKAGSSRPPVQRQATPEPAPAAQAAPAQRTRKAPVAQAPPAVPQQRAAAQPSRVRTAPPEANPPAAADKRPKRTTKGRQ
ncbi:hypothetical protein CPB85DRAFT_169376 [Mucidula mucida]|nr:hypothetical protein CPB85DRAFT_461508 [Mucidula mucida]KAF8917532.1 hypothetical protein CPB85DRAFT_169376 [Mucidula mucida]